MSTSAGRLAVMAFGVLVFVLHGPVAAAKPPVPDLTDGGQPDKSHDWTLGPTGARGWIWGWQGHTTDARQILITEVASSSPASGVLDKGDVLLGADGKDFDSDARIALARSIARAESQAGGGLLRSLACPPASGGIAQIEKNIQQSAGKSAPPLRSLAEFVRSPSEGYSTHGRGERLAAYDFLDAGNRTPARRFGRV